jgi:hypothetical protein
MSWTGTENTLQAERAWVEATPLPGFVFEDLGFATQGKSCSQRCTVTKQLRAARNKEQELYHDQTAYP